MSIKDYWWNKAKEASAIVGWFPTVILAQWQWETSYPDASGKYIPFTSPNLIKNNNIAGQTWLPYMGEAAKGTARAEGGFYIKYADPIEGYTDFILSNPRYANVQDMPTEEAQIKEIAASGWAADPNYCNGLISVLNANKKQGYVLEVDELKLDPGVAQTVINTWLKPSWQAAFEAKDTKQCDYLHWLAQELRKASGLEDAQ